MIKVQNNTATRDPLPSFLAGLAPEVEALAQQAPRAQSAGDVAMALKREGDCFRMVGVEEPED